MHTNEQEQLEKRRINFIAVTALIFLIIAYRFLRYRS